jgi:chemotaxis protein CheD
VAREQEVPRTLHPGDVVCATRGERLFTLLGSCVAVAVIDPRRTIGAMCHIVHPAGAADGPTTFAAAALSRMHTLLLCEGIAMPLCLAWVIGGGNMFANRYAYSHIGQANAMWALDALRSAGLRVIDQDLGGPCYRRVTWAVGVAAPSVQAVPVEDLRVC